MAEQDNRPAEGNWFVRHRQDWIAETLRVFGFINRQHIQRKFGISVLQASYDLQLFQAERPGSIHYNKSSKRYEPTHQGDDAMNMTVKQPRVMNIMDRSGHTTMEWDVDDPVAVKAAKAKFDEYKRQGYQAFAIVEDGDEHVTTETKGRRIDEFDNAAEKIMLIPQLRGG